MSDQFPVGENTSIQVEKDARSIREKIKNLEEAMRKFPQIEVKPTHYFAKGLYAREVVLPKGMLVTGKVHLVEHLVIISRGDISVLTDNGVKRIRAPFTMVSKPGTKRVVYVHEETVFTTIHSAPEDETDVKKLEALFVRDNFEDEEITLTENEMSQLKETKCLT